MSYLFVLLVKRVIDVSQSRNTSSQYCNTFKEDIEQRVQTTTLPNISKAAFMNKSFAIVALSYQAPM